MNYFGFNNNSNNRNSVKGDAGDSKAPEPPSFADTSTQQQQQSQPAPLLDTFAQLFADIRPMNVTVTYDRRSFDKAGSTARHSNAPRMYQAAGTSGLPVSQPSIPIGVAAVADNKTPDDKPLQQKPKPTANEAKLYKFVTDLTAFVQPQEDSTRYWKGGNRDSERFQMMLAAAKLAGNATLETNFEELWQAYVDPVLACRVIDAIQWIRIECAHNPAAAKLQLRQLLDNEAARTQFFALVLYNLSSDASRTKGVWQRLRQINIDMQSRRRIAEFFMGIGRL